MNAWLFPWLTEPTHGAEFSPCRTWRYTLWRHFKPDPQWLVAFIGLNPSTADETEDDPTVRRCIGFARDWGFDGMVMLNLFGFRATDPKVMKAAADPVGPLNNEAIALTTANVALTVCCWGTHGAFGGRDRWVSERMLHGKLKCFGLTKGGQPRHPLYLAKSTKLVDFL